MESKRGQVLLITIMLLAAVLTVVLSVTYKTTTETQLTKLEEENQKALAAAEAGIEKVAQQGSGTVSINDLVGSGFSGQATVDLTQGLDFTTPLLQKDQQYSFYLSTYDDATKTLSGNYSGNISSIYFGSGSSPSCSGTRTAPLLEFSFITYDASAVPKYGVVRELTDPCGSVTGTDTITSSSSSFNFDGNTYAYKTSSPIVPPTHSQLLVIRVLYASTKIGIQGNINFSPQGKKIISEAKSQTGVSKKVQLFQSYPQIPAEFFITTF